MSDTPVQEQPVVAVPTTFKLTAQEIYTKLQTYTDNADKSMAQLEANITAATNQIKEWQRMQFMIVGQKQLAQNLASQLAGTGEQAEQTK